MQRQQTLAEGSFETYRKVTKREKFLAQMDQVVPWASLCKALKPYYPKPEGAGRPPIGLERMLRMYFVQQWFNLSDPGVEEALYDSRALRLFVGIDLGNEPVPDETTLCKFRHFIEKGNFGKKIFKLVHVYLEEQGLKIGKGTIVDATIIEAPRSTKNKDKKRDEEMASTKKGNQWYFGMKAHVGVDSKTKLIHTVVATAANTHDSQVLGDLLHGDETRVWGDSAYSGQREQIKAAAPSASDFTHSKGTRNHPLSDTERAKNKTKSSVRAKGEHPFLVVKKIFGFAEVCYRGLDKNANRLFTICALTNIYMVRNHLLRA